MACFYEGDGTSTNSADFDLEHAGGAIRGTYRTDVRNRSVGEGRSGGQRQAGQHDRVSRPRNSSRSAALTVTKGGGNLPKCTFLMVCGTGFRRTTGHRPGPRTEGNAHPPRRTCHLNVIERSFAASRMFAQSAMT